MSQALFEPGELAPHNQQSEEQVLGAILINPPAIKQVYGFLKSDDFFILRNGWIYEAMLRLFEGGEEITIITLSAALKGYMGIGGDGNRLEEIGGSAYLTYLASNTATSIHTETNGKTIHRLSKRRGVMELGGDYVQLGWEDLDTPELEQRARHGLDTLFSTDYTRHEPTLAEIADNAEQRIFGEDAPEGVSFGIRLVDMACGKLQPGDLVSPVARTGVGKTRYVSQRALAEAQAGYPVLFMTTEEAEFQTFYRLIEMMSDGILKSSQMRAKRPIQNNHDKQILYLELAELLKDMPLEIMRVNDWSVQAIRKRVERAGIGGYRLVVVDYPYKLGRTPGFENRRMDEDLSYRMEALKNTALDFETVVMAPWQVKPASEKKKIYGSSDLAECDKAGHQADFIIGLHRPDKGGGAASISLGKTRWGDGDGRVIPAYFDLASGMYKDAPGVLAENGKLLIEESSIF